MGIGVLHQIERLDAKASLRPHLLEQRDVAAAAAAEVEIPSDDDYPGGQLTYEHLVDEVFGRLGGSLGSELDDEHVIDSGVVQQLEALRKAGQLQRSAIGAND